MRGLGPQLFRAGSSAPEKLRFVFKRCVDADGAHLLSRPANYSAAALGMSRHFHLLVDETGRAYSANLARLAAAFWGTTQDRQVRLVLISFRGTNFRQFGEGLARMRAWVSREELAGDSAAC